MKNYSSRKAKRGKTSYRTPSRFIAQKSIYERRPKWRLCLPAKASYGAPAGHQAKRLKRIKKVGKGRQ